MKLKKVLGLGLIFALTAAATPTPAMAQRPDTRAYTCGQVIATTKQYETLIWTTGQNTYSKILAYPNYCGRTEVAEWIYVPTLDNPRCRAGYICKERLWD